MITQALDDFFNRRGCTDPKSSNYDPKALIDDDSCKPNQVPNCQHLEVAANTPPRAIKSLGPVFNIGNLWLVSGPSTDNMCLVAYAFA